MKEGIILFFCPWLLQIYDREESPLKLRWLTANSLELQYTDGTRTKILLTPTSNIQVLVLLLTITKPAMSRTSPRRASSPATSTTILTQESPSVAARVMRRLLSLLAVSRWEEQFLINASTLNQVEGGVVDLAFTSTATYQMGLVVSKDSLSEDDDVSKAKQWWPQVVFRKCSFSSSSPMLCSYSVKSIKSNLSD